jgi:hypothetical protein
MTCMPWKKIKIFYLSLSCVFDFADLAATMNYHCHRRRLLQVAPTAGGSRLIWPRLGKALATNPIHPSTGFSRFPERRLFAARRSTRGLGWSLAPLTTSYVLRREIGSGGKRCTRISLSAKRRCSGERARPWTPTAAPICQGRSTPSA